MKNRLAPINQLPPEVLTLISDSWKTRDKVQGAISLTHVCQAWRVVFISHSPLWANFDCVDADKTRVYLERSKSSPINLRIAGKGDLAPHDPLLQVIPHATGRLKSLAVFATPERVNHITTLLSRPAPHLEYLLIDNTDAFDSTPNPILPTTLFNGDLSSLHRLHLECVHTQLPWKNMANLTSFALRYYTPPGDISTRQLLDFLENAPRLESVDLRSATSTSGVQDDRLVSLAYLKWIKIVGCDPCSFLLDHLLIPVGAGLEIYVDSFGPRHLPRRLNNLMNLSGSTNITLSFDSTHTETRFTGPNGQLSVTSESIGVNPTPQVLDYLVRVDTTMTEQLEISRGNPQSRDQPYQALFNMKNLRTLKLSRCQSPHLFLRALHPNQSSSETVVCPKLEELVLVLRTNSETFNIKDLIKMAAARALGGAKLRVVRIIVRQGELAPDDVLELRKHILDLEYVPGVDTVDNSDAIMDDSDDIDDSEDSGDSDNSSDSGGSDYDGSGYDSSDYGW